MDQLRQVGALCHVGREGQRARQERDDENRLWASHSFRKSLTPENLLSGLVPVEPGHCRPPGAPISGLRCFGS